MRKRAASIGLAPLTVATVITTVGIVQPPGFDRR
jgi:hypothetical protein